MALFAALSYAVTQSGRGSGSITREQETLALSHILQYAASLERAIQRLTLMGGCVVGAGSGGGFTGTIGFDSAQWNDPTMYDNANAPADNSCDIFDPAGGGITWQAPPSVVSSLAPEYLIGGFTEVIGLGESLTGSDSKELIFWSYVTRNMCISINNQVGLQNPGGDPPTLTGALFPIPPTPDPWMAIGEGFMNSGEIGGSGEANEAAGFMTGCVANNTVTGYILFHVLVVR